MTDSWLGRGKQERTGDLCFQSIIGHRAGPTRRGTFPTSDPSHACELVVSRGPGEWRPC